MEVPGILLSGQVRELPGVPFASVAAFLRGGLPEEKKTPPWAPVGGGGSAESLCIHVSSLENPGRFVNP